MNQDTMLMHSLGIQYAFIKDVTKLFKYELVHNSRLSLLEVNALNVPPFKQALCNEYYKRVGRVPETELQLLEVMKPFVIVAPNGEPVCFVSDGIYNDITYNVSVVGTTVIVESVNTITCSTISKNVYDANAYKFIPSVCFIGAINALSKACGVAKNGVMIRVVQGGCYNISSISTFRHNGGNGMDGFILAAKLDGSHVTLNVLSITQVIRVR